MNQPKTALGRKLAAHEGCQCETCEGQGFSVIAEAELGALELVVTTGAKIQKLGVQRVYLTVLGPTGRVTMFTIDVPIEAPAEPGTRVYLDKR